MYWSFIKLATLQKYKRGLKEIEMVFMVVVKVLAQVVWQYCGSIGKEDTTWAGFQFPLNKIFAKHQPFDLVSCLYEKKK